MTEIEIRPAQAEDLPLLERRCWPDGEAEMHARLSAQGTCSIIALDGGRPVAQLYLRTYQPGLRSPKGIHHPTWWADLNGVEGAVTLPERTAILGCWHVGRVREPDGSEREAPEYRGRGLGNALLAAARDWLRRPETPFEALAAKATDSEERAFMGWLGGLPLASFTARGFERLATYADPYLTAEPEEVPAEARVPNAARFHLVLLTGPARD